MTFLDRPDAMVTQELTADGVLLVTLNRTARANSWCEEMELDYYAAFDRAVIDPAVRSVLLSGNGRHFCPGMDSDLLREITAQGRVYMSGRRPQTFLRTVPKPVVAAVSGACAGIGFVQAMMADIRFTSADARWCTAFGRIGLVAEDGVAWRLQRVCGDAVASDLLLSSRVVDGEEAARLGLAHTVPDGVTVFEHALAYATELTRCSPASMALIKGQLLLDADETAEQARLRARAYLARAKMGPDYPAAIAARDAGTQPAFAGLSAQHGYLPNGLPTWAWRLPTD